MSNVNKTIVSNAERTFLIKNLTEWTRLDGRAFDECRNVQIEFGKEWGCCYVSLGKTKVVAQVSCELQMPKSSRPSEGMLTINLELNPMGDPNFEAGRQSELSSQLNRLLEKCIKDSKAIDLESLCVKMNERVWSFRVDVNLLNHEGNILDCASIAALAALSHFRRPDVTSDGIEFKIHSIKERDPIPTVIHHYPVCISYAIFNSGLESGIVYKTYIALKFHFRSFILADPTLLEEGASEAFLSVALNAYKELCGLHLGGKVQLATQTVLETTNKAAKRASIVIDLIKEAVEQDTKMKLSGKDSGFTTFIDKFSVHDMEVPLSELHLCLDQWTVSKGKKKKKKDKFEMEVDEPDIVKKTKDFLNTLDENTAELIPETDSGWELVKSDNDDDEGSIEEDIVYVEPVKETIDIPDSGSEEEDVMVLESKNVKS